MINGSVTIEFLSFFFLPPSLGAIAMIFDMALGAAAAMLSDAFREA